MSAILVFFVVMLTLGTLGYLKQVYSRDKKVKFVRTGPGRWSGGWVAADGSEDDEDDEDDKPEDTLMK